MLKGKTILVVDDEKEIVELMTILFRMNGADVLSANDGNTAFKIYKENPQIDAVLTDVLMPGEAADGISLTKKIRNSENPSAVVIVVTGFSRNTESAAMEAGADRVMSKPFDLDGIVNYLVSKFFAG